MVELDFSGLRVLSLTISFDDLVLISVINTFQSHVLVFLAYSQTLTTSLCPLSSGLSPTRVRIVYIFAYPIFLEQKLKSFILCLPKDVVHLKHSLEKIAIITIEK